MAGNGNACSGGNCGDGGPATEATLNAPFKVFVDGSDDLYIADQYDERIRFVSGSTHKISTVAGNGELGFSGDGGAATAAALAYPTGVFGLKSMRWGIFSVARGSAE